MTVSYYAHMTHQLQVDPYVAKIIASQYSEDLSTAITFLYKQVKPQLMTLPYGRLLLFVTQHSDQGTKVLFDGEVPAYVINGI